MELILNDQTRLSVTISIGVVSRTDIADLESAVRIADGVLYLAKRMVEIGCALPEDSWLMQLVSCVKLPKI